MPRPNLLRSHNQRHDHADEDAAQGEPEIPQADRFVIATKQRAHAKSALRNFWCGSAAAVVNHSGVQGALCGPKRVARRRRCQYNAFRLEIQGGVRFESGKSACFFAQDSNQTGKSRKPRFQREKRHFDAAAACRI